MSQVVITAQARAGMIRCQNYLHSRSQVAAQRAQNTIYKYLKKLEQNQYIGRPFNSPDPEMEDEGLRELVIPFGNGSYLALYKYVAENNVVYILAFKHGREESY